MTRSEYVERVLSVMRHVTTKEREAIRAEIDAHIEDHICDLLDLDYDEALAEERTMVLMGDPEEVGRELDQHYKPTLWDSLEGIATILLIVMGLQALLGFGILFNFVDSVEARIAPERKSSSDYRAEIIEETDYRVQIGNDVLKIYQVSVGEERESNAKGAEWKPTVEVMTCVYDRIPGGIVSGGILGRIKTVDQRNVENEHWGGGTGGWGAHYKKFYIPIQPGDTYVTFIYDRFGESVELKVPLPEVTS